MECERSGKQSGCRAVSGLNLQPIQWQMQESTEGGARGGSRRLGHQGMGYGGSAPAGVQGAKPSWESLSPRSSEA